MSRMLDIAQLLAVIAVLAGALILSGQLRPQAKEGRAAAIERALPVVSLADEKRLTYTPTISLTGTVVSRTITQVAALVSGQVDAVAERFRAGANVRAGEVLFGIDPSDYLLGVERASAEIANARAALIRVRAEAGSAREEWARLYPEREITPLAAMIPQVQAAGARLSSAEAAGRTAELSLARTRITSPVNAYVVSTELDVGQIVSSGQPVGVLQPMDSIEVEASMSVSELAAVSPAEGRAVRLQFRSRPEGEHVDGKIVRVAPRLDPRTRLARVYIALEDQRSVWVGEFADIEVIGAPVTGAIRLPQTSLFGTASVWVVEDGVLLAREVEVLAREPALILAPFDNADGSVAVPPFGAYEGMRVRLAGRSEGEDIDFAD